MARKRIFVSHAEEDLELVHRVLDGLTNLPFELYIAVESAETGRIPQIIAQQIENCDAFIPILTRNSAQNRWVNQEIGHASANSFSPIIPVFEQSSQLGGFIQDMKGIALQRSNLERTTFEVISHLRSEFEPLGGVLGYNWYIRIECTYGACGHQFDTEIEAPQSELWEWHEDEMSFYASCPNCGTEYHYDPATFYFLNRKEP